MNHPCHIRSVCATAILLAGCGGDQAADRHEPLVDTLRSGTVVVQNSPQGLWDLDPGARWTVVESVRIGSTDGGGPDVFGSVPTLIVDDLDRMWVVDAMANELRVFDAAGASYGPSAEQARGPPNSRESVPFFTVRMQRSGSKTYLWSDGRFLTPRGFGSKGTRAPPTCVADCDIGRATASFWSWRRTRSRRPRSASWPT